MFDSSFYIDITPIAKTNVTPIFENNPDSPMVNITPISSGGGGGDENVEYGYAKYGNVVENENFITWSGNQAAFIISNTEEVLTDVIGSNPWELVTKVSITNSGGQMYFGLTNYKSTNATSNSTDAEFQTSANATHEFAYIRVYTAQSNNYYGTHTLGTTFSGHLKLEYTGTQYILSYSKNNKETWTPLTTYDIADVCTQKKYAFFRIYGIGGVGVDYFDAKETYLTVNGKKVWQAMQ